jgi:hypothetical protein
MSNPEQIKLAGALTSHEAPLTGDPLLQHVLGRIEQRLAAIENQLADVQGRKSTKKRNYRPWLTTQLSQGWMSEAAIIEKTGWSTSGVKSFITQARGIGYSVETDTSTGALRYRFTS